MTLSAGQTNKAVFGGVSVGGGCLSCLILATKTHYPNISRLQQTSCATLVGHLNNAFYISRKKNPTRCCILEATINRVAAVWAGMYSVSKCTASPKETTTRRRNSVSS